MNETVLKAVSAQIDLEFAAAHQYLAMSAWFEDANLPGFAQWMRAQWEEEIVHALKFQDFVIDRGAVPIAGAIKVPKQDFETPLDVFEAALAHEQVVTASINDLYELALEQKDYTLQILLQWFITEQLEEEKSVGAVCERIRHTEGSRSATLILDAELGQRPAEHPAEA